MTSVNTILSIPFLPERSKLCCLILLSNLGCSHWSQQLHHQINYTLFVNTIQTIRAMRLVVFPNKSRDYEISLNLFRYQFSNRSKSLLHLQEIIWPVMITVQAMFLWSKLELKISTCVLKGRLMLCSSLSNPEVAK